MKPERFSKMVRYYPEFKENLERKIYTMPIIPKDETLLMAFNLGRDYERKVMIADYKRGEKKHE